MGWCGAEAHTEKNPQKFHVGMLSLKEGKEKETMKEFLIFRTPDINLPCRTAG